MLVKWVVSCLVSSVLQFSNIWILFASFLWKITEILALQESDYFPLICWRLYSALCAMPQLMHVWNGAGIAVRYCKGLTGLGSAECGESEDWTPCFSVTSAFQLVSAVDIAGWKWVGAIVTGRVTHVLFHPEFQGSFGGLSHVSNSMEFQCHQSYVCGSSFSSLW